MQPEINSKVILLSIIIIKVVFFDIHQFQNPAKRGKFGIRLHSYKMEYQVAQFYIAYYY